MRHLFKLTLSSPLLYASLSPIAELLSTDKSLVAGLPEIRS
jgi:hypothetical protein